MSEDQLLCKVAALEAINEDQRQQIAVLEWKLRKLEKLLHWSEHDYGEYEDDRIG